MKYGRIKLGKGFHSNQRVQIESIVKSEGITKAANIIFREV
jgi:hypothetical protein